MSCSACAAVLPAGARFCGECGAAQALACGSCGALLTGSRFCTTCGAPVGSAPPPAVAPALPPVSPPAPVAERRLVSSLFADLVGFTPISEGRDPEAVRELLSAYFVRAREVVERYGGVVEKFIGDAVFAVWGVPAVREDDAELAVRAALDLVSAVSALGGELGIEGLVLRAGVTTGQVAVTLGAVGEGMVAGDAVNTAARVQSVAGPGEVWVDDTTRSLTTAALAFEPVGGHALKGKAVPVELFRVLRTTGGVGGESRVDGLEAPFVGRDRELRMVKELFHSTTEERRARLVLVVGDPGIGKSRLAWEFEKYLDAITTASTWWMRARCLSYGQGVAGRVVAELVRSLLRVGADDEAATREALDARLAVAVPDERERGVLRPRLLALLGLTDAVFEQADLFACWRGFLEALTSDGSSVTCVVEDLQWADDGFFAFLDHLLDAARGPVLVLALARPEVAQRRAGIGAGRRSATVFLDPLPDPVMCRLLDGLVADLPGALRDELVARADGIPLYAVETVRSLIDRDVVVPRGGRYVVDAEAASRLSLADLAPPASLQALLAARLDVLTPVERRVVQDASVLGLSFTRAGLEVLTPAGTDLDPVLEELRRKEILTVDLDPRSSERGQLRFVQALLRGVSYDSLSRRDRKARHLAVVDHLAGLPEAEAISGVLVEHVLDAAAAVPDDPDVPALRDRAVALLEQAARHAADVGAPEDAVSHDERLIALAPDDAVVARACARAAAVARSAGLLTRAAELIVTGLAAAERAGDEEAVLRLRLRRAEVATGLGDRSPAVLADLDDVLARTVGRPDRLELSLTAARLVAVEQQFTGDAHRAGEAALGALHDAERYGTDRDFAFVLDTVSTWASVAGYRRLNLVLRQHVVTALDERDKAGVAARVNTGVTLLPEDVPAARASLQAALRGEALLGIRSPATVGATVLGAVLGGEPDLARRTLAEDDEERPADWQAYTALSSAVLSWHTGDPSVLLPRAPGADVLDELTAGWDALTAAVETAPRDLDAAAGLAASGVRRAATPGLAHEDLPLLYALACDVLLAAGDLDRLEEVTALLEPLPHGQRYRLLDAHLQRGRAMLSPDPAPGLRCAVAGLDAMGAVLWAAVVRVELAQALLAAGDAAAARQVLDEAEPVLRRAGAGRRWLDAVDALRQRREPAVLPG